jgi:sortase A
MATERQRRILQPPSDDWGPLPPHSTASRSSRALRWLERVLLTIGVVSLGYYSYVSAESYLYQAFENRELDAILHSRSVKSVSAPRTPAPPPRLASGSPIGRIEIPRLRVSAIVRAGSDARTLRLAVGHIPGTALPGHVGNVGLAGHRDTFFRRLQNIRTDDEIRITTPAETFTYRVERVDVVRPTDTWVLEPTAQPMLTLVTCYPFTYVGSAPKRFIVTASLDLAARPTTGTP